ncbi:MAG: hypothetical protein NUV57_06155 [archaeon]|nr:hypothetical protein [archaeon]
MMRRKFSGEKKEAPPKTTAAERIKALFKRTATTPIPSKPKPANSALAKRKT